MKKKNVQDSTLKNTRRIHKRIDALVVIKLKNAMRISALELVTKEMQASMKQICELLVQHKKAIEKLRAKTTGGRSE